jgi:hypothetical protein
MFKHALSMIRQPVHAWHGVFGGQIFSGYWNTDRPSEEEEGKTRKLVITRHRHSKELAFSLRSLEISAILNCRDA